MAILPHDGPDAGPNSPAAVDLKRAIVTNVGSFKSASKSVAWVDEMMALREDAEEADAIGFCSRIFTQLSLPYRDPGTNGAITWVRQNGPMRLQLNPLLDIDADGQAIPAFPYGKYPRLILPWLSTQVVRREAELESDGSLTIELGDSMRDFLKLLNLPYGGKSGRLMREQALWGNQVRLSSAFVQSVLTAKIPTDMRALKLLSERGGPLAMDIYMWLSYRLFVARRPTLVPWEALQSQFGSQVGRLRKFKELFTSKLILISLVYPIRV